MGQSDVTTAGSDGKNATRISKTAERLAKTLLAGGIAGCCAKTTVAPLDRIKILLQAHNRHYKDLGVVSALKRVQKLEGLSGWYRGNGVHMFRVFPYAAIQFTSFEQYKKLTQQLFTNTHICHLMSGSMAGLTAVVCTYPLDMVRARLAFQVKGEQVYVGIIGTLRTIVYLEGGVKALYRGIVPSLLGMVPYAGLSFYSFELLKKTGLHKFPELFGRPSAQDKDKLVLALPAKVLFGGLAGAIAQTLSYPLDVVRRRVQLCFMLPESHKYTQSWYKVLWTVYKEDGIFKGLFRGMSINYIRVMPMVSVSFTVYETTKQYFGLETGVER